jgi:tetratricopeptide (TPR) repeat protein
MLHEARALPTRFAGREVELATLDAALERAVRFKAPQAITIIGPPGIGKSCLAAEWLSRRAGEAGVRVLRAAATPGGPPRALLASLLRDRFEIHPGLDGDQAMVRFRGELQRVLGDRRVADVVSLLGGFLGFELPESPLLRILAGKPQRAIEMARAVLGRFLEDDARAQPLVVVCEDLQQADDESLDILEGLGAEIGEAAVVLVATARPDFLVRRPSWTPGVDGATRIDLGPAPGLGLPDAAEARPAVDPLAALSREEAAQARVAALSPAERDVLARGAVFGGLFWTGGVVALGRLDAAPSDETAVFAPDPAIAEIRQILDSLAERDYVMPVEESDAAIPSEAAWGFRRALEQSLIGAAVEPDLTRRRKAFAAQWLESRGGAGREQRLEALAQLYVDAGDKRRAAYCFITAAAGARGHLLPDRAHVLYLAGIALLDLDDAVAKMDALYQAGDLAARLGRTREALGHFREMLRLAWRLDLPAKGGAAHGRIGRLHGTLGEHKAALGHLELARRLFEAAGDLPGIAAALDDIGRIHFLSGAPEASLEHHRAALAVRERLGDDRGRALALARMGQVEHETGNLAAAAAHFRASLELRRRTGDGQGVVASLLDLGGLERDLGRLVEAQTLLEEGRALAREQGERLFECSLSIELGDCLLAEGQPRRAREEHERAREIARQFGARVLTSEATRGLAEAELALGDLTRARDDARAAFEIADRIGALPLAGAALRVVAASVGLGAPGEADLGGAREMFDRAVEMLSKAGAELELARTLRDYADFEERVGRRDAATELLRQAALIHERARRAARSISAVAFSDAASSSDRSVG